MALISRPNRSWYRRACHWFDSVASILNEGPRGSARRQPKTSLRFSPLEERVVPATNFVNDDFEVIGVVGRTYSVRVEHSGIGTSSSTDVVGRIDWGDKSQTTYSGWKADVPSQVFTHTYSIDGDITIQTQWFDISTWRPDETKIIRVDKDVPPELVCPGPDCVSNDFEDPFGDPCRNIDPGFSPPPSPPQINPLTGKDMTPKPAGRDLPPGDPSGRDVEPWYPRIGPECPVNGGGTDGNNPSPFSAGPVRYADGVVRLAITDIGSSGYGMGWSQTRSWSNGAGYDQGGDLGTGWVATQLPSIVEIESGTVALISNGTTARYFDATSSTAFQERFFGQNRLSYNSGTDKYALLTASGVTFVFSGFGGGYDAEEKGQFISRTDPYGSTDEVYSRNAAGNVTEIRRGGSNAEAWVYDYFPSGDHVGKLQYVSFQRYETSTYVTLRKVEYSYYGEEAHGNLGDLKKVIIKDGSNNVLGTQYMRYFQPGEANGYAGALKMYLGFDSYARLDAWRLTQSGPPSLDSLSDSQVQDFADLRFQYDSSRRVSAEWVQGDGCSMCAGGVGEYTFEYAEPSGFAPGYNVWTNKTTETLPDDSRNVVFTNAFGQVMLSVRQEMDGETVDREWPTYYRYDNAGRVILTANPSAFTPDGGGKYYDEARSDLVYANPNERTARFGSDVPINGSTSNNQIYPQAATSSVGTSVVVWQSDHESSSQYFVYGQLLNAAGQKVGSEFKINDKSGNNAMHPDVAMDSQGNFVVVWNDSDGGALDIHARLYDRFGNYQGAEFTVNDTTTGDQSESAVAMTMDGTFVVTWTGPDATGTGIYARQFALDGAALSLTDIAVNKTTSNDQFEPSVAVRNDGGFIVTWGTYDTSSDVYFRRFHSDGSERDSSDQFVNTGESPQVASDATGNFVIAFTDYVSSSYEIYFERYEDDLDSSGVTIVNTTTSNNQVDPAVTMDTDGDFAISWSSNSQDGSGWGTYARTYLHTGTASSVFRVNTTTAGSQQLPSLAMDAGGMLMAAFQGPDASSVGVYAQIFDLGKSPYLHNDAGLITKIEYATTTTATDKAAGDVAGYFKSMSIQRGESGTAVPQLLQLYLVQSDGTNNIYPVASRTMFSDTAGSTSITTSYSFTFDTTDKFQINKIEISRPVVTTGQNGSGSANVETYVTDGYGYVSWVKDSAGALFYRTFDVKTGAVTKRINDVNTALGSTEGGYANLPDGWSTPTAPLGFGNHLITSYSVDFLGRVLTTTDPLERVTYRVYNDVANETRVYPYWDSTLYSGKGGPTGPTIVTRWDRGRQYGEAITMSAEPSRNGSNLPTGTESITSMQSLIRNHVNLAGQVVSVDQYFKLDDVTYSTNPVIYKYSSGDRHNRSKFDYDFQGLKRTETANGTITRYLRDVQGRVTEVWIGTDDTPSSGYWPVTTTGTNLTKVQSSIYDGGGIGDSNLTSSSQYPDESTGVRTTKFAYDWRNRVVAIKAGAETGTESTELNRQMSYTLYDNLDRTTETRRYDGDAITIDTDANTDGVPDAPSSSLLRAKSTAEYDSQSRVFRTSVHEVSPTDGTVGRALSTDTWYDARGQAIKIFSPGGLVQKQTYDGLGRVMMTFATNGGGDSAYGDTDDVSGDTVFEQTETTYDENSNLLRTVIRQRLHSASGTGALGDSTASPGHRASYMGMYYDLANRLKATVNVGTNGGTPWTRPGSVPSVSDTVFVQLQDYDAAGQLYKMIDPRGIESRSYFDALGRTSKTIQNFTGSGAINSSYPDENKTTEFEYDPSGNLTHYIAWLNESDFEDTEYTYGVTAGSGGNLIYSNDLLATIYYPDPDTVGPVVSQFTYAYNALGERIQMEDANGTVHEYTFDLAGRPVSDKVVDFSGEVIDDSVLRLITDYDSAGRAYRFTSWDAATDGAPVNRVLRKFNGFGQLTHEYQEADKDTLVTIVGNDDDIDEYSPFVEYGYSDSGNESFLEALTYANGHTFAFVYDGIGRLEEEVYTGAGLEPLPLDPVVEAYEYLGLGTVVVRGGDVVTQSVELDRFGRVSELTWEGDSTPPLDHFKYGYDRDGNRLYRTNELYHEFDELYHASGKTADADRYDGLNQLTAFVRGALSDSNSDGLHDTTSDAQREQSWAIDGLGNFTGVTTDSVTEEREHDFQNRLTGIDSTPLTYDLNGNLTEDDQVNEYTFDAWNRMVGVGEEEDRYAYDPLGRRVKEGARTLIYSQNWQVLEERVGGETLYQYIWSPVYVDAMVARVEFDGETAVEILYVMQDANFNVMALVDSVSGLVVERYTYDPYGRVEVRSEGMDLKGSYGLPGDSDFEWVYLHQGGRWDDVAELYSFRRRDYSARLMRWVEQDPIGLEAGDPNVYRFVENNPIGLVDPYGLQESAAGDGSLSQSGLGTALEGMATSEECKREAKAIQEAIYATFKENWRIGWFSGGDRVKGYLCFEWAWAFADAFNLVSSGKCFTVTVEGADHKKSKDGHIHAWVKITSNQTGKSIYVDDGFLNGNHVHDTQPVGTDYIYNINAVSDISRDGKNIPKARTGRPAPRKPPRFDGWGSIFLDCPPGA